MQDNSDRKTFAQYKRQAEDLMALTEFMAAEKLSQQALSQYPDLPNAVILLETVRREWLAYRNELQARLYRQVKQYSAQRKWEDALGSAKKLLVTFPASKQAQKVRLSFETIQTNARIQQARQMRDMIKDLLARNRKTEALGIADKLVSQFPETQAARQLRPKLSKMRLRN